MLIFESAPASRNLPQESTAVGRRMAYTYLTLARLVTVVVLQLHSCGFEYHRYIDCPRGPKLGLSEVHQDTLQLQSVQTIRSPHVQASVSTQTHYVVLKRSNRCIQPKRATASIVLQTRWPNEVVTARGSAAALKAKVKDSWQGTCQADPSRRG